MGHKKIIISECVIYDLIYGKLKGPVTSDAPKGMKIKGVFSEIDKLSNQNTGDVAIQVSHPDWAHVPIHSKLPILPVTFSTNMDLSTADLIKRLQAGSTAKNAMLTDMVCSELKTNDATYAHLFEDFVNIRFERDDLRKKLDDIMELIHDHTSE